MRSVDLLLRFSPHTIANVSRGINGANVWEIKFKVSAYLKKRNAIPDVFPSVTVTDIPEKGCDNFLETPSHSIRLADSVYLVRLQRSKALINTFP